MVSIFRYYTRSPMSKKRLSITDLSLKDQKVLMRVDFNVPLDKSATIKDDTRIRASLASIQYTLDQGGSVILMSHLGRPKGGPDPAFSLSPCAKRLSELLQKPVLFAKDCIGEEAKNLAKGLKSGRVLLLENLRFHPAEEKPELDPGFAKELASLGTIYVNDAFGSSHRAHSSITEVPKYFPKKASGFLMEREIQFLENILEEPKKPFIAIIGGAKVSTKIGVLKALLEKVDALLIGGGMAYTFMKAKGQDIGKSLFEEGLVKDALGVLERAKKRGIPVMLPVDHVAADSVSDPKEEKIVKGGIPDGFYGVDIGPDTISLFKKEIAKAKTLFWNGPLGIFENERFSHGTKEIALSIAKSTSVSIIGGGDSVAAINECGVADKITHISTGGGATLEYIEQGDLPGITALTSL